jgi:type IX secretion system PorP/SprF family membrane protein
MIKLRICLLLFVALLQIVSESIAQYDPLFSQYMFNELYINPAYAGSKDALSVTLFNRAQWTGFNGAPNAANINIHTPISQNKMGIGLNLIHDKIGVSKRGSILASYAYRIPLKNGYFSLGLQAGIVSVTEKYADLNPNNANDPEFAANAINLIAPNFGFGAYYYNQKFYAGISIPRMVQNKINFDEGKAILQNNKVSFENFHYFITTGCILKISEGLKLKPQLMTKLVKNAPTQIDVNLNALLFEKLWLGGGYRTSADLNAMVGFQFSPQFLASYSYDYSTSALKKFNSGSHEFGVNYIFSYNKKKIVTARYF